MGDEKQDKIMTTIKPYYEITIRDYSIMEKTGNIGQFNKSIIPTFLLRNKIYAEIQKAAKELNGTSSEDNKEDLIWEVLTIAKINELEASYLGVVNILNLGIKIDGLKQSLNRRDRRKIKTNNDNLSYFISRIKEVSGIDINSITDLEKVRKNLEFRKDKYNENFTKRQQKPGEKMFLMAIALGVFSYLNQPINVDMSITDFAVLRTEAVKRIEKERAKIKK